MACSAAPSLRQGSIAATKSSQLVRAGPKRQLACLTRGLTRANALSRALHVLAVAPDGNCFFRALAQSSHYNQNADTLDRRAEGVAAADLRTKIVVALEAQRPFLEPFLDRPWDGYIAHMSRSGAWGGELELAVAPSVLQAPVFVYQAGGSWPIVGLASHITYGEDWLGKAPPVRVVFYGAHYDSVICDA